jgi:hypothetical protein
MNYLLNFYFLDIDWNLKSNGLSSLTDKYLLSTWLSVC